MKNLYYIEYKLDETIGQMYFVDTGIGIVEIGVIENDRIFDQEHQMSFHPVSLHEYVKRIYGATTKPVRVL